MRNLFRQEKEKKAIKDLRKVFRLEKEMKGIKYRIIWDIKSLSEHEEEGYYTQEK